MTSQKKDLYIFMNAYTQGKSGADMLCVDLTKKLPHKNIIIITSRLGSQLFQDVRKRITHINTSHERQFIYLITTYILRTFNILLLKKKIKNHSVLFSSSDFFPDVIPAFFLKKNGRKWIQIIHHLYPYFLKRKGNIFINAIAYYLQKISFFLIKKRADAVIVVNPFVKKQLIEQGFNRKKLSVIPNGTDISHIKKIKRNKTSFDGVFVGRFHPSKGIFEIVQVWSRVTEKIPSARLAIIGTGNEEIKKFIANNAIVFENIDNNTLFSILKSSKILLFPSHEEGFGRVIAESMACETPVICWNLPVYKTVFNGNYISVPFGNIDAFATMTIKLLKDAQTRKHIAEKAEKFVKKYDWNHILPKYIKLFSS